MAKKQTKKIKEERLEDILWSCRNHLRGKADMSDKRDVLLTLVFLKFMSDRFEEQQEKIRAKYPDAKLAEIQLKKPAAYGQDGVIFLPEECRWRYLVDSVEPKRKALALDNATSILDKQEEKLKNALPQNLFVSCDFEPSVLKSVMEELDKIDRTRFGEKDLIGRVYEYYLQAFSINADKEEGEFYTPRSLVELIATMIEPFDGTLYDPCCGSGGMFIQCAKLVEAHGGNTKSINVYGQESEPATFRLAKMNLAVRGISYHLGEKAASTFSNDQHKDLKVDYVMTNPPFNLKPWRTNDELLGDPRWKGYATPPDSNANYAWILHILSKLNPADGVAGFLLANGALDDGDTLEIRKKLIENDKVEAIIVLPRDMFYSTDTSVTLWIINQNKRGGVYHGRTLRNREGQILFMDLRSWDSEIYEKKYIRFTQDQIAKIANIYHTWQTSGDAKYSQPELYYTASHDEIVATNFSLVPSRYIKFVDHDSQLPYAKILNNADGAFRESLSELSKCQCELQNAVDAIKSISRKGIEWLPVGECIVTCDETNGENAYADVYGLNKAKSFMPTVANLNNVDLSKYKIVRKDRFVFSGMQTGRDRCIRLGLYASEEPGLVSPAYATFEIRDTKVILPEFFFLYFVRKEMDRYGWFISDSSVRANLDWPRFTAIKIPIPRIEDQQKVVSVFRAINNLERCAAHMAELSKQICPALMQRVIQG